MNKEFEAWYHPGFFNDPKTLAFEAWKESRRQALAESSAVCINEQWTRWTSPSPSTYMETFNKACADCATSIRSLK